jgi:hypothetical protein
MTDGFVTWLHTQLDEHERVVKAAPPGPWTVDGSGSIVAADGSRVVLSVGGKLDGRVSRWPEGPAAAHIVACDPVRVLQDIDAKRQLLQGMEQAEFTLRAAGVGTSPHDLMTGAVNSLRRAARLAAAPYSSRPGYREEWRP